MRHGDYQRTNTKNRTYKGRNKHNAGIRTVNQRVVLTAITVMVLLGGVLLGSSFIGSRTSQASDETQGYKCYTSIRVEEGDSLWKIADRYMGDMYESRQAFMEEVIALNHIGEDEIHAGEYLVVPYYETENL